MCACHIARFTSGARDRTARGRRDGCPATDRVCGVAANCCKRADAASCADVSSGACAAETLTHESAHPGARLVAHASR